MLPETHTKRVRNIFMNIRKVTLPPFDQHCSTDSADCLIVTIGTESSCKHYQSCVVVLFFFLQVYIIEEHTDRYGQALQCLRKSP